MNDVVLTGEQARDLAQRLRAVVVDMRSTVNRLTADGKRTEALVMCIEGEMLCHYMAILLGEEPGTINMLNA